MVVARALMVATDAGSVGEDVVEGVKSRGGKVLIDGEVERH